MNPDKFDIDDERKSGNSLTTSTSMNKSKSATSNKSRRTQKVNWNPSSEKETYRTVVVNYRYAKPEKNSPRSSGANSRKRHWSRMFAAMAAKQHNDGDYDDDDVPNLRELYDCSKEDLCIPDTPVPSYENIAASGQLPKKQSIKLEVFCLPDEQTAEQEAIVEEYQLNTIQEGDAESLTERGENQERVGEEAELQDYSDERLEDNFVFLRDNEVGETLDFDADFCCAMSKDKVDGTQQTCIIKNTTKATQKPERHNERLQTPRRSRERPQAISSPTQENNENSLQLTVAEIPKETDKSKSPSTQGGFRQRQQELHRYRIAVEQKRLELLEAKLQRERDEMLREQILFERELELKAAQLRQINDDKTVDIM